MKPNCYECKYRGMVPGDAHSCCEHPAFAFAKGDALGNIMAIFAGVGRSSPVQGESAEYNGEKIVVKGSISGIRRGWFNHPWNFDPTWLEECNGFTEKVKI